MRVRCKIWMFSLPGPQIISISDQEYSERGVWKRRAAAQYKIPALLNCNRESRMVAEAHYVRAFEALLSGIPIYMNFEKDLLHFDSPWALLHLGGFTKHYDAVYVKQLFENVRYVSMSEIDCLFKTVGYLLSNFKSLDTLVLMGVNTNTDDDLLNFYMPLGRMPGGFVAMEDSLGLVVETRTELVERRGELVNDSSDQDESALLLINSVATVEDITKDWEKKFDASMDEKYCKGQNASEGGKLSRVEYWRIDN